MPPPPMTPAALGEALPLVDPEDEGVAQGVGVALPPPLPAPLELVPLPEALQSPVLVRTALPLTSALRLPEALALGEGQPLPLPDSEALPVFVRVSEGADLLTSGEAEAEALSVPNALIEGEVLLHALAVAQAVPLPAPPLLSLGAAEKLRADDTVPETEPLVLRLAVALRAAEAEAAPDADCVANTVCQTEEVGLGVAPLDAVTVTVALNAPVTLAAVVALEHPLRAPLADQQAD